MEGKSLSERLRDAALERARLDGEIVDSFVLDSEGVIDLRELERDGQVPHATQPPAALAGMKGMVGAAGEVGDLYDERDDAERRWPFGRRQVTPPPPSVRTSPPEVARRSVPLTRLSALPLSTPPEGQERTAPETTEPVIDLTNEDDVRIDLDALPADATVGSGEDEEDRPTRPCPSCGGTGRRDLFDRFSQVEFYSCDSCVHMWQVKRGS